MGRLCVLMKSRSTQMNLRDGLLHSKKAFGAKICQDTNLSEWQKGIRRSVFRAPWWVGTHMNVTWRLHRSCEVGSDPLTTKIHKPTCSSKATGYICNWRRSQGGNCAEERYAGGKGVFPVSCHHVNYNIKKVQHSFIEHLLDATHCVVYG